MGIWSDALRRELGRRAPQLLQALKDDKTGIKKLSTTRRRSATSAIACPRPNPKSCLSHSQAVETIVKAAVNPAMTTVPGLAQELTGCRVRPIHGHAGRSDSAFCRSGGSVALV